MRASGQGLALVLGMLPCAAAEARPPFAEWNAGVEAQEPVAQVQWYDPDTAVIRQSVQVNFEAPFAYLLFGRDRALLLDSGAEGASIRPAVDASMARWAARHGGRTVPLIVAHSHSHRDHRAGDAVFAARPETTVIGLTPEAVAKFFSIRKWPDSIGRYNLGGRVLDVIPTPGHQPAHIMIYDRKTRLLLSGDALYPGRLTIPVNYEAAERASIARVSAFAATHTVRYILGAHIEMTTTAGRDIPGGAPVHLNERRLELPVSALFELDAVLRKTPSPIVRQVLSDFIIEPVPARPD